MKFLSSLILGLFGLMLLAPSAFANDAHPRVQIAHAASCLQAIQCEKDTEGEWQCFVNPSTLTSERNTLTIESTSGHVATDAIPCGVYFDDDRGKNAEATKHTRGFTYAHQYVGIIKIQV